jgi:ribosomal protein S18 acetylase RimI-like enzyme
MMSLTNTAVTPARPDELADALRLLFRRHPPDEAAVRTANALRALERGDLAPEGVLVARAPAGLCGVLVCLPLRGATGLLWPPVADTPALEGALIDHALDLLRSRGARVAQALLSAEEVPYASPLLRRGFRHVTVLEYLRRPLDPAPVDDPPERLTYDAYDAGAADLFHETLLRTYEGTLDCPELNPVRDVRDIIAGHQAQGRYDPQRWWLARETGRPAAVLLLNEIPEWRSLDVAYLGVVPEARGRGHGHELTRRALRAARAAGALMATLAVDRRNAPARRLYARHGFEPFDERAVFLAFLV